MLATGGGMYGDIAGNLTGQRFKTYDYQVQQDMARAGGINDLIGAGIGAGGIGTAAFFI
jgi:hypothetical protein